MKLVITRDDPAPFSSELVAITAGRQKNWRISPNKDHSVTKKVYSVGIPQQSVHLTAVNPRAALRQTLVA